MAEFLLGAALFVLGTVALGLVRILRGPEDADRMMAAQLLGTGGVASLLLLGVANEVNAVGDLDLLLDLLAAFASVAFVTGAKRPQPTTPIREPDREDPRAREGT
jgi:multicomponent Na+:H+ antiporter subunit F